MIQYEGTQCSKEFQALDTYPYIVKKVIPQTVQSLQPQPMLVGLVLRK